MTNHDDNQSNPIARSQQGWRQELKRQYEQGQLLFERNKKALFDAIKPTDITHISVEFDGSGDSGQIESILASTQDEKENRPLPAIAVPYAIAGHSDGEPQQENIALATAIENLCYYLLEQHQGGWEDNAGGFGCFTFDVAAGAIHLEINQRFEDYTTTETSF